MCLFKRLKALFSHEQVRLDVQAQTALALALAIRLPLSEAKELLSRAGYTLSETCRRDQILMYFFQHPQPSLIMINGVLETLNESPIGQR